MCHRWWRRGERAPGTRQIGYHWAYIFSAVRPDTGDDVTLVMPSVNADLKAYCRDPTPRRKRELQARFDRLFTTTTGFATLDRLLARLHANKIDLLRALERPDIPLHTNGSENDIRCQVTRRKISGGTRSETGRDCRDAFLGLMKTCDKLGVSFWDYLGSRLDIPGAPPILPLPDLICQRAAA